NGMDLACGTKSFLSAGTRSKETRVFLTSSSNSETSRSLIGICTPSRSSRYSYLIVSTALFACYQQTGSENRVPFVFLSPDADSGTIRDYRTTGPGKYGNRLSRAGPGHGTRRSDQEDPCRREPKS